MNGPWTRIAPAKRTIACMAALGCAISLAACGSGSSGTSGGGGDSAGGSNPAAKITAQSFPADSYMAKIKKRGKIVIGTQTGLPLIADYNAVTQKYSGMDIEVGKMLAHSLGLKDSQIEWKLTSSNSRIPFLQNGQIDLMIGSLAYSADRANAVGMAGPYYSTRPVVMTTTSKAARFAKGVDDLKGVKECGSPGSTMNPISRKYGANIVTFKGYDECVDQLIHGGVDAILLPPSQAVGYMKENPGKLVVKGKPTDEIVEDMIGFSHSHPEMCGFLKKAILDARKTGAIEKAYNDTEGTEWPLKDAGKTVNLAPTLHATCGVAK